MSGSPGGGNTESKDLLVQLLNAGQLDLPVLPEVPAQLLRLTNDPNCDPVELADLIRRDPSIASNLLRLANSVMYTSGSTIVSLQQAIARLGFRKIREIVIVICCQNRVFDVNGFEKEVRNSFRQSLGAAAFGREIARLCRLNVEEAFLCGLLHDVGRPVLLQALLDIQSERRIELEKNDVLTTVDHFCVDVGGDLIVDWSLPQRVADIVRSRVNPQQQPELQQNAYLLGFARDLAQMALHPSTNQALDADLPALNQHSAIPQLNLYPEQIEMLLSKKDFVRQWIDESV